MSVKLAVFDIAGTTVADDHAVAIAFSKAFEVYGYACCRRRCKAIDGI